MLVWKEIKPSKLKDYAFRFEFLSMIHRAEKEIIKEFEKTTEGFEHEVVFESIISLKGGPSVYVSTNDQIYGWLNDGTAEHDINAVNASTMAFPTGYTSKTVPGSLTTRAGGEFGDTTYRTHVHHPGFEARNFDKKIEEIYRPRFKRMAEEAMRNAARKSGHFIG